MVGRRKHGSSFARTKTSPLDWEKVAYLIIVPSLDPHILAGLYLCVHVHTGMEVHTGVEVHIGVQVCTGMQVHMGVAAETT